MTRERETPLGVKGLISVMRKAQDNKPRGNSYRVCRVYSPEPRAEVCCVRLFTLLQLHCVRQTNQMAGLEQKIPTFLYPYGDPPGTALYGGRTLQIKEFLANIKHTSKKINSCPLQTKTKNVKNMRTASKRFTRCKQNSRILAHYKQKNCTLQTKIRIRQTKIKL